MTRRMSTRARAQEIYRETAAAQPSTAPPHAPLIPAPAGIQDDRARLSHAVPGSPLPRGRAEGENLTAQSLTEKVRALYEGSAVPVAEIARLAGVTERTLYKYAQKGRWKGRYAWTDSRIDAGGAKRRRRAAGEKQLAFAPVQGAGGRFIRRADKDKPVARGLKATDPPGARRANAACAQAADLAARAQLEAEHARWEEVTQSWWRTANGLLDKLNAHREARAKAQAKTWPKARPKAWAKALPRSVPDATDSYEQALLRALGIATEWLQDCQAQRERLAEQLAKGYRSAT